MTRQITDDERRLEQLLGPPQQGGLALEEDTIDRRKREDFTGRALQGFEAVKEAINAPGFKPGPSMTDALKVIGNIAMGTDPRPKRSVMDPNQTGVAELQVNPTAARMVGSFAGRGMTNPLLSEIAAQGAHLINRAIGNPSDEGMTPTGKILESAISIGTQLPFAIKGPLSPNIQNYTSKLLPSQESIFRSDAANRSIRRLNDMKILGVDPNLGVTGGYNAQWIVNAQSKAPFTVGQWEDARRRLENQLGESFAATRKELGMAVERETGGKAVLSGIQTYADKTERIGNRLYQRVKGINELPVDIAPLKQIAYERLQQELQKAGGGDPMTKKVLADAMTRGIKDPKVAQTILSAVDQAIGEIPFALSFVMADAIPFSEAKILRSSLLGIGRQQSSLFPKGAQSAGKELSGLLDQNMEQSAAKNLAPSQFDAWRKANTFWRERSDNLRAVDDIWKTDSGQEAFNKVIKGAKDGPANFNAIMKTVPKDRRSEFMSVFLNEIGMETKGGAANLSEIASPIREFSPVTFMSNWANLPESVKKLVGGEIGAGLRDKLDAFARVGGYVKQSRALSNPSGTSYGMEALRQLGPYGATATTIGLAGAGQFWSAAGTALLPVAMNGSARLMTNPKFVDWLSAGSKLTRALEKGGVYSTPAGRDVMKRHFAKLATIAATQPIIAPDIQEYIQSQHDMASANEANQR